MVLQGKSNINAKINNEEETECHMSGKLASKDIFEAFIQSCDNLHQLGEFESILHAAVKYHDFEFVKLFLETIVVVATYLFNMQFLEEMNLLLRF